MYVGGGVHTPTLCVTFIENISILFLLSARTVAYIGRHTQLLAVFN